MFYLFCNNKEQNMLWKFGFRLTIYRFYVVNFKRKILALIGIWTLVSSSAHCCTSTCATQTITGPSWKLLLIPLRWLREKFPVWANDLSGWHKWKCTELKTWVWILILAGIFLLKVGIWRFQNFNFPTCKCVVSHE